MCKRITSNMENIMDKIIELGVVTEETKGSTAGGIADFHSSPAAD